VLLTTEPPSATFLPLLMDFGSAGPARLTPSSSKEANRLQDWFAQTCSILYRAPEMLSVQSGDSIDERTDCWSLGGLLYWLVYGVSPFDAVFASGNSVHLAALSADTVVQYPSSTPLASAAVISLIRSLLSPDASARPTAAATLAAARRILADMH
jgi:serine/threonine kinase 16